MIKKLLFIITCCFFIQSHSFGQACSPSSTYTNTTTQHGVYPDSAQNFDTAYVGVPYSQLVTIVVPPDTVHILTFPWDSTVLTSVTGLPASLSHACWNNNGFGDPNRCSWKGNSIGCAIITGTPVLADVGTHNLTFNTNSYIGGSTSPNPYVITYYKIVVVNTTAVNENPQIHLMTQNTPNPFRDKTEINFTAQDNGTAKFKVYNLIGKVIYQSDVKVKQGINKINLDAKDFDSGIYFYSIVNGTNAFTRKMVVNK